MTKSPRQVAELARLLTKADPEDDDLRFIEGRAWLAEGDVQAARRAIGSVPLARRSGVAEAALLVAELRDGHFDQSEDRYMRADFDGTLFQEFCEAIIGLDTPQRARAIAWLMTVLDTNRAAALITSAKSAVPAGPSLTAIASRLSDHAPTDAARLLESACPLQELDTEALTLLVDLRQRLEQGAVADPLALLVDRLISGGDRDEAIQRVEELQGQLHWGDLQAILQPLIQSIAADGSDWDMDRTIAALTVATMAAGAVRQELAVDPASAMDTYVRLRASFGTGSPEVNAVLDDLSLTLEDAWEATETHRNALAEAETSMIPRIRDRWSGKRLLIVGGRRPVWFSDVSDAVGFHDRTAWFESSPNQRPSQERLRQLVQAGRIDLLVIIVDYIGHSTSEIKSFAQERGFQTADAKSGRLSFLRALVEAR
jgi:hypothetical protein